MHELSKEKIKAMNSSTTSYKQIITDFFRIIELAQPANTSNEEDTPIEFTAGNLVVRIFPHAIDAGESMESNAIVVEADLMLLDLENRDVNHDRFLILHQLNEVSRLTTGIIAFITEEGMLSISKIISVAYLTGEILSQEVAVLMEAAEQLYDGWNHLAELSKATESGEKVEGLKG